MSRKKQLKLKKDFVLTVGGKPVLVKRVKGLKSGDNGSWGEFDEDDDGGLVIKVDADASGDALVASLAHEACHAVFHVSGYAFIFEKVNDGLEEGIVRCIENIYEPMLKELYKLIEENS